MRSFIFLSLLLPFMAISQSVKEKDTVTPLALADSLAVVNQLHGPYVGFDGKTTDQYRNFQQLADCAEEHDLLHLCNHKNAVVRAYAFWGLARRQYGQLDSVLLAHARDEELITEIQGGVMNRIPVIEFMQWVVSPDMMDAGSKKLDSKVLKRVAELRFSDR